MGRMTNLLVAAAVVTAGMGVGLVAAPTANSVGPLQFQTTLSGANEVPPNASTATGSATVTLSPAEDQVAVSITFNGLGSNTTASHIHEAPAGTNGPVKINFVGFPGGVTSGNFAGTLPITPALVAALRAGNTYVNVHTTGLPAGEIRGQLAPVTGSEAKCRGQAATTVGTNGNDVIVGTEGADVILGLDGDDAIRGLGGHDFICGGNGADLLSGGGGRDVMSGGDGDDEMYGGRGRDRLFGGAGADELAGGPGNDYGAGGTGKDFRDSLERP